jgi:hypothetical protein
LSCGVGCWYSKSISLQIFVSLCLHISFSLAIYSFWDLSKEPTIDPCYSGLEDIHRTLQAVSGSLSDKAESVPPLVTKASFTLLEQVSSTWNSWMGGNDTETKELPIETKTVQHHDGKEGRIHRKKISERQQHPEHDSRSVDSNNSEDLFIIREVLVRPDDQGSLCFQEDEMGSAVHDAIVAQYLEQPYVNGKRLFVKN